MTGRRRASEAMRTVSCVLAVLCLLACAAGKEAMRRQHGENPVRTLLFWGKGWQETPLERRLGTPPPELVAYLRTDNLLNGFAETPRAADPPPAFLAAWENILASLTPAVRHLLAERLVGIFAVEDLGSSGFAETVADGEKGDRYALIVLDRGVLLRRTANEWASWKERSVVRSGGTPDVPLWLRLEEDSGDTVDNAVRFILLHELGHVLGLASGVHPSWNDRDRADPVAHPFVSLSWRRDRRGAVVSRFEDFLPGRSAIRFYGFEKAGLDMAGIVRLYEGMRSQTNFPSMQAMTDFWEDFAESFATFQHAVRDGRPWEVRVQAAGQEPLIVAACWDEPRCRDKRAFMARWFADPRDGGQVAGAP